MCKPTLTFCSRSVRKPNYSASAHRNPGHNKGTYHGDESAVGERLFPLNDGVAEVARHPPQHEPVQGTEEEDTDADKAVPGDTKGECQSVRYQGEFVTYR